MIKKYINSRRTLDRAYKREILRRKTAETLLEDKSRESYLLIEEMKETNAELQATVTELVEQRYQLSVMGDSFNQVTSDLKFAANVQSELLPSPIDHDKVRALGLFEPAEFMAGDGFDYFFLENNTFAFYTADVVGHGMSSSMLSFAIHNRLNPQYDGICSSYLRNSNSLDEAVVSILSHLNSSFYTKNDRCMYFTMVFGLIDLTSGQMSFGQAGHPAPMHYSPSRKTIIDIGDGGFPIAMFSNAEFQARPFQLTSGDRLFVYSDGITECMSSTNVEYGRDRLAEKLTEYASTSIADIASKVKDDLVEWNGPKDFADDVSMLIIEYK